MATWTKTTRHVVIHEWYVPNGCWNQLQQAISEAHAQRARDLCLPLNQEISDTALLFKATDDGVILYYEDSMNEPPF